MGAEETQRSSGGAGAAIAAGAGRGSTRARRPAAAVAGERLLELIIRLSGVSAILFVVAIFFFIFREAAPVLFSPNFHLAEFLFSTEWYPTSASNVRYGTLALTLGTLSVTGVAIVLAVPFGLGAAVFISEFCGPRLKETLKIVIELLAAIPSVVWGFIGLTVMSKIMIALTGAPVGVNLLNGGVILALMSVPIIVSIGEDALKAVPDSYREAALAMGANRWQTVRRVLFPAARNGLLAAVLLGVGRAVGETMAVLMATGHAVHVPHGLLDSVRTLTANVAAELGESPAGSEHYRVLFLTGTLLFLITFAVNLGADLAIRGVRKR
jgi:phosphate transport system permease protein